MDPTLYGLVAGYVNSYGDLKIALGLLKQIKDRMLEEGAEEIPVKRAIMREISALKKRTERQYALDSNRARSISSEAKRERKLDQVSEDFYALRREIKVLETLFKLNF